MMRAWALATFVLSLCGRCEAQTVRLASTEWPPYSGAELVQQGAATAVVRAAFASMGVSVKVEFFPWARAVMLGTSDKSFDGYFPGYPDAERMRKSYASLPIGSSPLGFAQRMDNPINWQDISDLTGLRLGVVNGYVNTMDLDAAIAADQVHGDVAPSDQSNLTKLFMARVDAAVIDRHVFEYLSLTDPTIAAQGGKLEFNKKILSNRDIHVFFKRTPQGQILQHTFDLGLKKINATKVFNDAVAVMKNSP
jgi:polar amino acid transport system substrate-binding protein